MNGYLSDTIGNQAEEAGNCADGCITPERRRVVLVSQ